MQLMMKQRIHQEIPPSDRCSLQKERRHHQLKGRFSYASSGERLWVELVEVPADVLWVGRVRNAPVVNVKHFAELGGTWLQVTPTALNVTSVEVLQNAENAAEKGRGRKERGRGHNRVHQL